MRSGKLIAGRFLLQGKLGSGPSGASFQGLDQATHQPVVVKLVDGQRVRAEKLPRPLKVILDLNEPSLERLISFGFEEKTWYFVRPWIEGDPLEARLWREPLPWTEALPMLQAVAKALASLHRAGVAHLGLSPSNLLTTSQGRLLVLDAGMSYLEPTALRLRMRPSMDLQANLAPEQARGENADARSDLFALGLLFHEALTGRASFSGAYPLAALARLQYQEPTPLRRLVPTAPAWAEELLDKLLAKDPARRPRDADALLKELEAFQQQQPMTPRLPRFGEREQRAQALLMLGGRAQADRPEAPAQAEFLEKLARKAGFSYTTYPDNSSLILVGTQEAIREQLGKLARVALTFKSKHPRAPLILAGGQGELFGKLPDSDLPDRAAALLAIEARRSKDGAPGLRIDGFVAALLRGEFPTAHDDEGHLLGALPPEQESENPPAEVDEENSAELVAQQATLDRLSAARKAVLRAASIFGEQCWRSGVEEIVGGDIDWRPLLDENLLRPRLPPRFAGETEFEFVDPKIRKGAYGSTVEDDRRAGHRIAARWLERVGANPEEIVPHLERTHDSNYFTDFCVKIAQSLLDRGEPEEALAWLDRGENSGTEEVGALLHLRLQIQLRMGQRTNARRTALRTLESLPRDSEEFLRTQGNLLEVCGLVGDFKRLVSTCDRLLKNAPPPPLSASWSQTLSQGALAALRIGKLPLVDSLLGRLDASLPWAVPRGHLLLMRALRANFSGYPAASLNLHRAAAASFREGEDEPLACFSEAEYARDLLEVGATFEAEILATQTLNRARVLGLPEIEARCKVVLGLVLYRSADFELARSTVREATSFFGGRGNKLFEGEARCALATILLGSADLEGARREAERAQGALSSFPPFQMRALSVLALAKLASGEAEEAQKFCSQASGIGEHLAPVMDAAVLLRPLRAQIAQLKGNREEARQLFLEIEQYLSARAASFEDPTLREAFLRHVPEHAKLLQLARLFSILPPAHDDQDEGLSLRAHRARLRLFPPPGRAPGNPPPGSLLSPRSFPERKRPGALAPLGRPSGLEAAPRLESHAEIRVHHPPRAGRQRGRRAGGDQLRPGARRQRRGKYRAVGPAIHP